MSKVTLNTPTNLNNDQSTISILRSNNEAITTAMDNTLSRDGTSPNTMLVALDMDGNQIINLPPPSSASSPARLEDIGNLPDINLGFPSLTGDVTAPSNNGTLTTTIDVGVWTNQRSDVSSATYTLANSDNHKTVALSASTPQIITVNAPSGYTKSDFVCVLVNESSLSRKKIVSADLSFTDFWLWPQQSAWLYKSNNGWRIQRDKRFQTYFALNLYVNSSGSDTNNDGMSTGSTRAFATLAHAIQVVQNELDCINSVTINLASNTYSGTNLQVLGGTGANLDINIVGDTVTPANVVLSSTGGSTILARDGAIVTVKGITFTGTGGTVSLNADQGGVIDFQSCVFGASTGGGVHLFAGNGGTVQWSGGTYAITGNATFHMAAQFGGQVTINNNAAVTVSGGLTFTNFAYVDTCGRITTGSGLTYTNVGATGIKYTEARPGVLTLNGVTLPGVTAGSTISSGVGAITGTSLDVGSGVIATTTTVSSGSQILGIATKTNDYVVTTSDYSIICNKGSTLTLTLLSAASNTGRTLLVRTIQAFTVVSASANVVPLAGGAAGTAILAATAGKWALLQSDGSNWQIMAAN